VCAWGLGAERGAVEASVLNVDADRDERVFARCLPPRASRVSPGSARCTVRHLPRVEVQVVVDELGSEHLGPALTRRLQPGLVQDGGPGRASTRPLPY
jgi:hypothetical protein